MGWLRQSCDAHLVVNLLHASQPNPNPQISTPLHPPNRNIQIILPFLQPTYFYGDTSPAATTPAAVAQQQHAMSHPAASGRLPIIQPALDFLHDFAMPKTLPDGRTESPGVLRIYLASMIILAVFYCCSAALQVRALGALRDGVLA
jgi:hypothetical protein